MPECGQHWPCGLANLQRRDRAGEGEELKSEPQVAHPTPLLQLCFTHFSPKPGGLPQVLRTSGHITSGVTMHFVAVQMKESLCSHIIRLDY